MTNGKNKQQVSGDKRAALMARLLNRQKAPAKKPGIPAKSWDSARRPLSFAQQRVWFLQQMEKSNAAWNLTDQLILEGAWDQNVLKTCLKKLMDRHEVLRMHFEVEDGETFGVVSDAVEIIIEEHDLSGLDKDAQTREGIALIDAMAAQPFDLSKGPLLRSQVLRLDDQSALWSFCLHHVIYDTLSSNVFLRELDTLFKEARGEKVVPLKPLPIQYADYATWQRDRLSGEAWDKLWNFWKGKLGENPEPLMLTSDHARPNVLGNAAHKLSWQLDAAMSAEIKALCRRESCTPFLFMMAAFKTCLFRYTSREDLEIGTVIANREQPELAALIGFFVNTVIYPSQVHGRMSFRNLLDQVKKTHTEVSNHGEMPFEKLVDAYQLPRDLSGNPLVRIMISLDSGVTDDVNELTDAPNSEESHTRSPFDLTLRIQDNDRLKLELEYNLDLFEQSRMERMKTHLTCLLKGCIENLDTTLEELPLMAEAEKNQLLHDWNQTEAPYPNDSNAHALLGQWVARQPDAPALVFGETTLSYQELDERANQLAHLLLSRGLERGALVGINLDRSLEMVIAVWGIFKAGLAYLPLDPTYPTHRIEAMVEDSGLELVLTNEDRADMLGGESRTLIMDTAELEAQPKTAPAVEVDTEARAYVIYTSGSTGKPKGVVGMHRGLCNLHLAQRQVFGITPQDRILQFASLSFDASLWEMVMALLNGATLVMTTRETVSDPMKLAGFMKAEGISVATLPPTMLRVLDPELPELRAVISAGEACNRELVQRWSHNRTFFNAYGPTETTVCATVHPCNPNEAGDIPIGRPLINTQIYILDAALNPVPVGIPGELHVAGAGLAQGYLGRDELTAARFPKNPFGEGHIYKTGDLAMYRPDGKIAYIGRVDDQVKIRGHRIEPGEIANVLKTREGIETAAVVPLKDPAGQLRLAAYYVTGDGEVEKHVLRSWLADLLPDYMIPAFFIAIPSLPLTPNGKVDRKALPKPDLGNSEAAYAAPAAGTQTTLAEIWGEILGAERIGAHDNFFALGGDSILSFKVVSRAAQAGLSLTVQDMFATKTLAELAERADRSDKAVMAEQAEVTGSVAATPIQNWFFGQNLKQPHHWNQSQMLDVDSSLSQDQVAEILLSLINHHDALRLTFNQNQAVHAPLLSTAPLRLVDVTGQDRETQHASILAEAEKTQASLDLNEGSLIKAVLFQISAEEKALLILAHHLIIDAISWRILLEDLENLAQQAMAGQPLTLPKKTTSFKDYATILGEQNFGEEAAYWEKAHHFPALPLPKDDPSADADMAHVSSLELVVEAETTAALLGPAQKPYRSSLEELILTGVVNAMGQWMGHEQIKIHLERHGRDIRDERLDLSRTVGWFTALFPVAFAFEPQDGLSTRIKTVKETLRQVPNGGLGYGAPYQNEIATKAPKISFNFLGNFDDATDEKGVFQPSDLPTGMEQGPENHLIHDLSIDCWIYQGCLRINLSYSSKQFERRTLDALGLTLTGAFEELVGHNLSDSAGGRTPSDFPLAGLDQEGLDRLLRTHGNVEAIYPLTPAQEGMLYHARYEDASTAYFVQPSFEIRGAVDVDRFKQACQKMVAAHDILRTIFLWEGYQRSLQCVLSEAVMDFRTLDLSASTNTEADLEAFYARDREEAFELSEKPPLRITWITLPAVDGEACFRFVFSHHHLLLDAWSLPIVLSSLSDAYLNQTGAPQTKGSYERFIAWLENRNRDEAETFWREYLTGMETPTELVLPEQTEPTRPVCSVSREFSVKHTIKLNQLARDLNLTTNVITQAAWALLLSRYSHKRDVLFGMTVAGRPAELPGAETTAGLFINTLPVRLDGKPEGHLKAWLKACDAAMRQVMAHESSALVDIAAWSEMPARRSLFETIVVFENAPKAEMAEDLPFRITNTRSYEENHYGITALVIPGEALQLELVYDGHRFPKATMDRMVGHFRELLMGLADGVNRAEALEMLTSDEKQRVLHDWNATDTEYTEAEMTLADLLQKQLRETPEAVAIIDDNAAADARVLTYAELHNRADQLAQRLLENGLKPGEPVGLLAERSAALMVSLLGIIRAGGCYVPFDPEAPSERLAHIVAETGLSTIFTQSHLMQLAEELLPEGRVVDAEKIQKQALAVALPPITIPNSSPAYIIYTSGSTGRPKGVLNSHKGIVNRLLWMQEAYQLDAKDRVLQKTPITFDVSVWELFWPLLTGASLVMAKPGGHQDPSYLMELIEQEGITTLHFVPSMLRAFLATNGDARCTAPRQVICSGEALTEDLVSQFHTCFEGALHNLYGPTEAAIDVTYQACTQGMLDPIPIGKPIANTQMYITGPDLRPVPTGVPGQLLIGGVNLAIGYVKRPDLTAERFIPNPFVQSSEAPNRLYCTGDLARYDEAGRIEFMGRIDHQVKLRGFRIELGEIEAMLDGHPGIRHNAVLLCGKEDPFLAAFVVSTHGETLEATEIKTFLAESLPSYMIPSHFVALEQLPQTSSGKVDRRALAEMSTEGRLTSTQTYTAPRNDLETQLLNIWNEVLGRTEDAEQPMGVDHDFFEMGGHSLTATRAVTRIAEQFGHKLPVARMFEHPTVAAMADLIAALRFSTAAIEPQPEMVEEDFEFEEI